MHKRRQVLTKSVRPQWYRRYAYVLPPEERVVTQPLKEIIEEEAMLKAMETPPPQLDRAEELARKLAIERATRIKTVLDLLDGNMKNVKEKLDALKPMTGVLEFMTEAAPPHSGRRLSRNLLNKSGKESFTLAPTSKWLLIRDNKIIRQKIKKIAEEMRVQKIRNRWKKAVRIVRAIIRFRSVMADIARTTGDVFKHFNEVMESERAKQLNEGGLYFDMAGFKVSSIGKNLDMQSTWTLGKVERMRSEEEVQQAAVNMRFLRSFAAFPAHFQVLLIKIGWIMDVPKDKVIIREGQEAHNFYFLMSGKAVAVKLRGSSCLEDHGAFELMEIYQRDAIFGEEGVFGRGHRQYSVTCIEDCQLLSINIDDYNRLCLTGRTANENPEHIRFLSQMEFLRNFPMKKLIDEGDGNIILFYFAPGQVVTRKTSESNHIYVIKSGHCRVLASVTRRVSQNTKTRTMKVVVPPNSDDGDDDLPTPHNDRLRSFESIDRFSFSNPLPRIMSHNMSVEITPRTSKMMAHLPRRGTGTAFDTIEESDRASWKSNRSGTSLSSRSTLEKKRNISTNANICGNNATSSSKRKRSVNFSASGSQRSSSVTRSVTGNYNSAKRRNSITRRNVSATRNISANARKGSKLPSLMKQSSSLVLPQKIHYIDDVDSGTSSYQSFTTQLRVMENLTKDWGRGTISAGMLRACEDPGALVKAASIEKMVLVPGRSNLIKEMQWIHLRDLRESDVIGIADLEIGDEHEQVSCDVAVVSEGSEVILIDKDYFLANSSPKMLNHLRESSFIMPDETTILIELKRQGYWKKFQAQCGSERAARRHGGK